MRGSLGVSGRRLQRLTRTRGLRLNGRTTHTARKVREGDTVEVRTVDPAGGSEDRRRPLAEHEAASTILIPPEAIRVVDARFIVVDKPAGIAVHPGGKTRGPTLLDLLPGAGISPPLHAVHRLDRDTSGLLLLARAPGVHAVLDRAVRAGKIQRSYLALVTGATQEEEGTVDAPIGHHPRRRDLRAVTPKGRPARTHWRVVERLRGSTLLEVRLETGRTHQVRVHLAWAGHPLVGDRWYGGPATVEGVRGPGRPFLHASRLVFPHPSDGTAVEVDSPLPPELQALREALRAP